MTVVVGVLALALLVLERELITTSSVLLVVGLLVPSLVVDLLILCGPRVGRQVDPMSQYESRPPRD